MGQDEPLWRASVAARLLEARRKNGRLGTKKSRSGCITCKERKVKCDEEKPCCKRCLSAGRSCEGYLDSPANSPPLQANPSQVLHLGNSEKRSYEFFLSFAAPRLAGSLDKEFWCGYVLQLAHAEPLVTDCLLAISTLYEHPQFLSSFRRNPYLRDEGTKTITEDDQVLHPNIPPPPDKFHSSALMHYNRAIRLFKERVESGSASPLLAISSCALFFCIEVIRDNVFAAFSLIDHGVRMLKHYASNIPQHKQAGLFRLVKLMFSRIGVTAAAIGHLLPADDSPNLDGNDRIPTYQSTADARDDLFAIMSGSYEYFRSATSCKEALILARTYDAQHSKSFPFEDSNVIHTMYGAAYRWTHQSEIPVRPTRNVLPSAITNFDSVREEAATIDNNSNFNQGYSALKPESSAGDTNHTLHQLLLKMEGLEMQLVERLREWLKAVESKSQPPKDLTGLQHLSFRFTNPFGAMLTGIVPDTCMRGIEISPETLSFLLMYYHSTTIWSSTRLALTESVFDEFTCHFEQIVHHAEIYLKPQAGEQATFTFETGAVAPLFLTTTRCRIPSVRRKALDLMRKAPRKESFHGAESTAEIASRVIAIEEEGLGLPMPDCTGRCACVAIDDNLLPPEERRVHNLELTKNTTTQRHEMTITRYSMVNELFMQHIEVFPI